MIFTLFAGKLNTITPDKKGLIRLNTIKRELLFDLEEYETLSLSNFGSVTDLIKRGQGILRLNAIYELFSRKVATMETIAQAEELWIKLSREGVIKVVTTLLATLLSLTTANAFVKVILEWSSTPSIQNPEWSKMLYITVVGFVHTRPVFSTIFIYFVSLIITILVLWVRIPRTMLKDRRIVPEAKHVRSKSRAVSPVRFRVRPVDNWDNKDDEIEKPSPKESDSAER